MSDDGAIGFTDAELAAMLVDDAPTAKNDSSALAKKERMRIRKMKARTEKQQATARRAAAAKKKADEAAEAEAEAEKRQQQELEEDKIKASEAEKRQQQGLEEDKIKASEAEAACNANAATAVETGRVNAAVAEAMSAPKKVAPPAKPLSEATHEELDQIVKQKKIIEEMNKKKKALLGSALAKRRAKTQAEHASLRRIEAELAQLDTFLSHDIAILRERIEDANREFVVANNRFNDAEKAYIDAKIELHKRKELKEHLTEHLIMIIQENEARKSTKLEELMERMALTEQDAMKEAEAQVKLNAKAMADQIARLELEKQELEKKRAAEEAKQLELAKRKASEASEAATDAEGEPAQTPAGVTVDSAVSPSNPMPQEGNGMHSDPASEAAASAPVDAKDDVVNGSG